MAFFDPKAKNIANYQRSIDEKKVSVSRYYDEIGRLYYGQYKDLNADNTKDINTRCEAVTRLYNEIEQLNHKILFEKGYILSYKVVEGAPYNTIKIALKYHPETKMAAIKKIERVSTPGLRQYTSVEEMPRVLNGLGIAIISTSKGIITDKEAKELGVGGEVLCYVY